MNAVPEAHASPGTAVAHHIAETPVARGRSIGFSAQIEAMGCDVCGRDGCLSSGHSKSWSVPYWGALAFLDR